MYIYNVTINIQEGIHEKWLEWMKNEHIPEMLATGKFTKALMSRVMVEEEMGGFTYSVQYTTKNKEMLQRYYEEDAARLRAKTKPFEGLFVAFRTELEIVSEQ
jgi:capsid protein